MCYLNSHVPLLGWWGFQKCFAYPGFWLHSFAGCSHNSDLETHFPQTARWDSKVAWPELKSIILPERQQLAFVYSLTHLHGLCSVCPSSAWFAQLFSTRGWPDRSPSHMNSFCASDSHFPSSLLQQLKTFPPFPGWPLGNTPSGAANPLQKWPCQVLAAKIIKSRCW